MLSHRMPARRWARWVLILVITGWGLTLSSPILAARPTAAEIVIDFDNGDVLHSRNADTSLRPASLAKIMTLYLLFEALDANTLSLDERLPVSKTASGRSPSKLYLRQGKTIRVRDAIPALVTKSANDVASVVAERLGEGSERRFARIMTRTAQRLGMTRTVFRNASGLHHSRQFTTARDIARLSRRLLMDFPHYYAYFSLRRFRWQGRVYKNHNNLLELPSVDGIKTGYLRRSGYHVALSAKQAGRRLIAVVMGGKTVRQRERRARFLLDTAFAQATKKGSRVARAEPPPPILTADPVREKHRVRRTVRSQAGRVRLALASSEAGGSVAGPWMVQVGAFWRHSRAYAMAERSIQAIPPSLEHQADIRIITRKRRKRQLYLARLSGFSHEKEARVFCRALEKAGIDCLPIAPS